MKTLLLTLTYLVGAGELMLAVYFWVTNSKSEIRRVMALLAFSTGMWVLVNAASSGYRLLAQLTYVFGLLIVISLLHFTLIYPYRVYRLDRYHLIGLYLPWLFFTYVILATKTVAVDFPTINNAGQTIGGPLLPALNLLLAGLFLLSLLIIFLRSRKIDGLHRRNLLTMFIALLFGGLPAIYFGVLQEYKFLPFNYLLGPIASSIWLGATTYLVVEK